MRKDSESRRVGLQRWRSRVQPSKKKINNKNGSMESSNSTLEAMPVLHVLEMHKLIGEVTIIGRYVAGVLVMLINTSIAAAFLLQKCRRPNAVQISPAGLLVLNLLIADALLGVVTIVNLSTFSTKMITYRYWCNARLGVSYLAMIGSHIALINVAVDRFVAITCTLQYRDWMTLTRSVVMLCCGWAIPVSGAVVAIASNDWRPGLERCSDIYSFKMFLCYVWVPSHIAAMIFVIVIQCRVYLRLRKHEEETATSNQVFRRFSHKSAKILFRVTTTFVLCWGPFDVMLVIIVMWFNPVIKTVYDVTLLFAQFSFLVNPLVYSYQTVNIRRPVSDLCADIKRWGSPKRESTPRFTSTPGPPTSIAVIGKNGFSRKSSSSSSGFTQSTSTT